MSRERLEELLELHEKAVVAYEDCDFLEMRGYLETLFLEGFIDYLIEQAERVQEMEEIKNDAIEQIDVTQRRNKRLENRLQELEEEIKTHAPNGRNYTNAQYITLLHENKRYREALEEIKNEAEWMIKLNDNGKKFQSILYRCEEALEEI